MTASTETTAATTRLAWLTLPTRRSTRIGAAEAGEAAPALAGGPDVGGCRQRDQHEQPQQVLAGDHHLLEEGEDVLGFGVLGEVADGFDDGAHGNLRRRVERSTMSIMRRSRSWPQDQVEQLGADVLAEDGRALELVEKVLEGGDEGLLVDGGVGVAAGGAGDPLEPAGVGGGGLAADEDGVDVDAAVGGLARHRVGVDALGVVDAVGEEDDDLAVGVGLLEAVERLAEAGADRRLAAVDAAELQATHQLAQHAVVDGQRRDGGGGGPERDHADAVVAAAGDEAVDDVLGRLEAVRVEVVGLHRVGQVEGDDDVDAAVFDAVGGAARLGAGQREGQEDGGGQAEAVGQVGQARGQAGAEAAGRGGARELQGGGARREDAADQHREHRDDSREQPPRRGDDDVAQVGAEVGGEASEREAEAEPGEAEDRQEVVQHGGEPAGRGGAHWSSSLNLGTGSVGMSDSGG